MKDLLFEPIKINKLEIKNRIYMPAMHLGMADNFEINDRIIEFYRERAKGGAGMITVGYATVDEFSGSSLNIGAHDDRFIQGLEKLSKAIRENNTCSSVQLNHAGRYNFSFFMGGKPAVAPSPIASNLTRETPRELTTDEIPGIIENFANAALRVKKAGFDVVEVLSGTGYLISEFLSPLTNKRNDQYGGSFENRMRFGIEIIQAIREKVGENYPVIVRMNGNDFMINGQGRNELKIYAKALIKKAGVDALCINVGWHEARVPQITAAVPRGAFAYLARGIKEFSDVPVIASHRINDPETARQLLADSMCDMVAMGRSLIADPFLPLKAENGREDEIIHCTGCAQGCFDNIFKLKYVECLCNPRAGHEIEIKERKTENPEKTGTRKKIMIIGGGPAGINAAIAASDRGHDVSIYEKNAKLGGQLYLAAAAPGRSEFAGFADDLASQVKHRSIRVNLNTETNEHTIGYIIDQEKPDHIILATGASPVIPNIPGVNSQNVVQAWDVLAGRVYAGKNVVIVGGGAVGVETALFLAEKGTLSGDALKFLLINHAEDCETLYEIASHGTKHILILEMLDKIGRDFGKTTRWTMLKDLSTFGIDSKTETKAVEITESGIIIETENGRETIPADTIVLAAGSKSENKLVSFIEKAKVPFTVIGDAKSIGMAFDAVHQGFDAGMNV